MNVRKETSGQQETRTHAPASSRRPAVISLFTGAGGLDLGFEAAGFDTRVALDSDHDSVTTLRHNRNWPVIESDILAQGASSKSILEASGLKVGECDVLIGGPPCQPFSKSGYWASGDSQRLSDPRSTTLGAYLRVLEDTAPRAFLLENVPGLAFSNKDEGLHYLRRSVDKINKRLGVHYSFAFAQLNAAEFGVPQERQRVIIVGSRDGADFAFPRPTHQRLNSELELDATSGLEPFRTSWDALAAIEEDPNDSELRVTGKWADLLPSIPEGLNYLYHTDRGDGIPLFGWRTRYWSFLLKLAKHLPSWTIAAQPGPAIGPFHWQNRRLSRRELASLQTFPVDYQFPGTLRASQKQIGNAVPSALAEVLARAIRGQFFGMQKDSSSDLTLLPSRRPVLPAPEQVHRVPPQYLNLVGRHSDHPGTGKGPGALLRVNA